MFVFLIIRRPPRTTRTYTHCPYTTLCLSHTAPDDPLAIVGLEPIDARGFLRQSLPDRQQKPGDHVHGAGRKHRHIGKFRLPCPLELASIGFPPLGFRHGRSEEHTSELQSLMRLTYVLFCLKQKPPTYTTT